MKENIIIKIAVLYDQEKRVTDLFHMHHISIYEKKDLWEETIILPDVENNNNNRDDLMNYMETLICNIADCKIIIGSVIVGLPYYILDKNEFIICEAKEVSQDLLEQISEDIFIDKKENTTFENISKTPVPVDNKGNYYFNFALVQKTYPEISSKKALLPFFSNQLFQSVIIECSHIMPWIDRLIEEMNLEMNIKRENGLYTLIITHKLCN